MDLGIKDKCAAVGGASAGLGFACASALAEEGVRVAICSRDAARIEAAAAAIGPLATPFVCDVSTVAGARDFVARASTTLGGLDILIANSGGPAAGPALGADPEQLRGAMESCFHALMEMCQAAVPEMRERGWGRIVAITTIGVVRPLPGMIYSNTARAAFTAYLRMLAQETAGAGITVNSLLPGAHETERLRSMVGAENIEKIAANNPTRSIGRAEDFGRVAAFLCSEHARYLTGSELPLAGGADRV